MSPCMGCDDVPFGFPWFIYLGRVEFVLCVGLVRVRRRLECLKRRSRMGVFLVSSEVGWFHR